MNASYPSFEGPAASALGGADVSWLVGFVIAGALYYAVTPRGAAESASTPVAEVAAD